MPLDRTVVSGREPIPIWFRHRQEPRLFVRRREVWLPPFPLRRLRRILPRLFWFNVFIIRVGVVVLIDYVVHHHLFPKHLGLSLQLRVPAQSSQFLSADHHHQGLATSPKLHLVPDLNSGFEVLYLARYPIVLLLHLLVVSIFTTLNNLIADTDPLL